MPIYSARVASLPLRLAAFRRGRYTPGQPPADTPAVSLARLTLAIAVIAPLALRCATRFVPFRSNGGDFRLTTKNVCVKK